MQLQRRKTRAVVNVPGTTYMYKFMYIIILGLKQAAISYLHLKNYGLKISPGGYVHIHVHALKGYYMNQ